MRAAVITGVSGQDGSYLAEFLLGKGYDVFGVIRRTSSQAFERIAHLRGNDRLHLVEGDVTDPFSAQRIIGAAHTLSDEPLLVFNLAAQSHVHTSFGEPTHTSDVVYGGCLNLLEAIRSTPSFRDIRFYQASSSEMFGTGCSAYESESWDKPGGARVDFLKRPTGVAAEPYEGWFQDELTPMIPQSPYAIAKLGAHHLVRLYREAYGLHASSGILFNHESSRRPQAFVTRKISSYVAAWAAAEKSGAQIPNLRLGNLLAKRDWGFAGDYVEAIWLMLQQPAGDDYVICTGETHTVEEFALKAFACVGLKADSIKELPIEIDQAYCRPSEVPFLRGCADKAAHVLGWKPKTTFSQLVEGMVYADVAIAA